MNKKYNSSTTKMTMVSRNKCDLFSAAVRSRTLLLFDGQFVFVVAEIFPSKQKRELGVVLLLLHGHLLKLGSISGDKLGQFVNDISQLLI